MLDKNARKFNLMRLVKVQHSHNIALRKVDIGIGRDTLDGKWKEVRGRSAPVEITWQQELTNLVETQYELKLWW